MSQLIARAEEAFKKRNYDYAIELYMQHLAAYPDDVDARKSLRVSEIKKFQDLGTVGGGPAAYAKGLVSLVGAWASLQMKKYDAAMNKCEMFLRHAPRHVTVLGWLGLSARGAGHLKAAVSVFEDILTLDHANKDAVRQLAQCHRELGDIEKSMAYYEQLKKLIPNDPEAAKAVRDLAATSSFEKSQSARIAAGGSFQGMVKDMDQAKKLEKDQHIIRTSDEATQAAANIRAEIEKSPTDVKLWTKLGETLLRAKDWKGAVEAYKKGLELKPGDLALQDKMGDVQLKQLDEQIADLTAKGDEKGAADLREDKNVFCIQEYGRRVKEAPTDLGLRYKLGTFLYKGKKFDEAISEFQQTLGDPRYKQSCYNMLGKCFASKGMNSQAIKSFEKAREGMTQMDENAKELTYNLGILYGKEGDAEKAIAELEKIIEVDINYRDVMKRLEQMRKAKQKA